MWLVHMSARFPWQQETLETITLQRKEAIVAYDLEVYGGLVLFWGMWQGIVLWW